MTHRPRILLTGPTHSFERWVVAARVAGWDPLVHLLVSTVPVDVDLGPILTRPIDWLAFTSSSAVQAFARHPRAVERARSLSVAVVGEATADRVRELGIALVMEPAARASELARALRERARPGARVLWPRGSLSDELARLLRESGLEVIDPIVYRTELAVPDEPLPSADAAFFPSPSCVRAFSTSPRDGALPPIALAIGPTTLEEIECSGLAFARIRALHEPTAIAFGRALKDIRPA